jgi:hypothetical protein
VQSRWLANRHSDTVVVFFHGLFGDPLETWRAKGAKLSFPELVASDTSLGLPDVFLVGYPSPILKLGPNIEQNAQKLRQDLIDDSVFARKNIVFIAHSEGGIVARRVITKLHNGRPASVARIKGVLLLAVPVHGSDAAELAYWASNNPQIRDLRPDETNTLLQAWESDWQDIFHEVDTSLAGGRRVAAPKVFCAYEELNTGPIRVVKSVYTATRCDGVYPLPLNHLDIAKPPTRDIDPYPWAAARIRESLSFVGDPAPIPQTLPLQTGWLYLGDYVTGTGAFERGPFFTGVRGRLPRRGDLITLTAQRELVIANYHRTGPQTSMTAPWRIKHVLDANDYTGIRLKAGDQVEVRDVVPSDCIQERGPEVSCSPRVRILWVRVSNPPVR